MADPTNFQHKGRIIRAEMETSATPDQAWEAWADPEKIAQWFVDRATGEPRGRGMEQRIRGRKFRLENVAGNLGFYLEHYFGRTRTTALILRPAQFASEQLRT